MMQAVCFIRFVQMKTVQLFWQKQSRPLKIVVIGAKIDIIGTSANGSPLQITPWAAALEPLQP
jgi:hypothetical protein